MCQIFLCLPISKESEFLILNTNTCYNNNKQQETLQQIITCNEAKLKKKNACTAKQLQ